MDLSGRNIDALDLGLVSCEGAIFDGASAVGAMFGCCPRASFRYAHLSDAIFIGDISGAVFSDAQLDSVSLVDATYDPNDPPIGLPNDLLATCRAEPIDELMNDETVVIGLIEYPVPLRATLAESATSE
jgi:uncharacterized protein YjbI with pentapeptide repeats